MTAPKTTAAPEPESMVLDVDGDVIAEAVRNGVLALEPTSVGDTGLLVVRPADWVAEIIDISKHEELPRARTGQFDFSRWESLGQYVELYSTSDTLGYIRDLNGLGPRALVGDLPLVHYVLDDHPTAPGGAANRAHKAGLTLRPTPAALRWGKALTADTIGQEELLDLVVDGITEIARPDGAVLRDLVADLHAVRTTEARSVLRTGGESRVELADNIALHSGTSNEVTIPENVTVVFRPWTAVADTIVVDIRVKPRLVDTNGKQKVRFSLTAPQLDDRLSAVVSNIASLIEETTHIRPLWHP